MKEKRGLKGSSVFIGDDFSTKVREVRRKLLSHLRDAKDQKNRARATMVFDYFLIKSRKFVLDSEDKLRKVTKEIGRPCIDSVSHGYVNGNHFSEGEKENLTPAKHSARASCDKPVSATRKNASDSETVEQVNLVIVSEQLAVTDTFSNENGEGFSVKRHIDTDN